MEGSNIAATNICPGAMTPLVIHLFSIPLYCHSGLLFWYMRGFHEINDERCFTIGNRALSLSSTIRASPTGVILDHLDWPGI